MILRLCNDTLTMILWQCGDILTVWWYSESVVILRQCGDTLTVWGYSGSVKILWQCSNPLSVWWMWHCDDTLSVWWMWHYDDTLTVWWMWHCGDTLSVWWMWHYDDTLTVWWMWHYDDTLTVWWYLCGGACLGGRISRPGGWGSPRLDACGRRRAVPASGCCTQLLFNPVLEPIFGSLYWLVVNQKSVNILELFQVAGRPGWLGHKPPKIVVVLLTYGIKQFTANNALWNIFIIFYCGKQVTKLSWLKTSAG